MNNDTMTPVPDDAPVMTAWKAYKETDDYRNTRRWALHEGHVDGSLWASFETGFRSGGEVGHEVRGRAPATKDPDEVHMRFCLHCGFYHEPDPADEHECPECGSKTYPYSGPRGEVEERLLTIRKAIVANRDEG